MLSLQGNYSILKKRAVAGRDEYGLLVIYDIDGFTDSFYNAWFWKILLSVTLIGMLLVLGKPKETVENVGGILCVIQLIPLVASIIPTEIALRKTFDKNGNRR